MAMAQSHWGLGPLVACPVGKPGCSDQDPDVYVNSVAIQEALQQKKMARLGTKMTGELDSLTLLWIETTVAAPERLWAS